LVHVTHVLIIEEVLVLVLTQVGFGWLVLVDVELLHLYLGFLLFLLLLNLAQYLVLDLLLSLPLFLPLLLFLSLLLFLQLVLLSSLKLLEDVLIMQESVGELILEVIAF
jgi:hypothetical protein